MKLKELIERIDVDAIIADECSTILERSIFYAVGVDTADLNYDRLDEQRRLFCNHIITWYCTDSWVGLMVYVFDREVVALSKQIGRKYDREFGWVSQDAYDKVKEFCYSFIEQEKDEARIIDFEEDMGQITVSLLLASLSNPFIRKLG